MKIEMGESLIDSWLNHVKECQLHQMNFKLSGNIKKNIPNIEKTIEKYQYLMDLAEEEFEGIFKKEKNLNSLLKSAEIDNIGVDFINNKLYAVDVAFHTGGLGYGNADTNAMHIAKKYLRTIFLTKIYFSQIEDQTIIFASPKVGTSASEKLEDILKKLRVFIQNYNLNANVELYINKEFSSDIYEETVKSTLNENDTSELFIRSIKLHQICTNNIPKENISSLDETSVIQKDRVGLLAKNFFTKLFENIDSNNDLLINFQDKEYSKKELNLNFPLLHKGTSDLNQQRYYKKPIVMDYYLTNDWYEKSRDKLEEMIAIFRASGAIK